MAKEKTNLYLLSIVAIVAIVGIVVLTLNSGTGSVSLSSAEFESMGLEDITGQTHRNFCSDAGQVKDPTTGKCGPKAKK